MRIVHVTWIDSTTESGWEDPQDADEKLELTHSVGIFVKETQDCVVLANSYDPSTDYFNGRIFIPFVCVKDVRTVCRIRTIKTK